MLLLAATGLDAQPSFINFTLCKEGTVTSEVANCEAVTEDFKKEMNNVFLVLGTNIAQQGMDYTSFDAHGSSKPTPQYIRPTE